MVGVLGVLVGVVGVLVGVFDVLIGEVVVLIGVLGVLVGVLGLNKLCSKQSLLRSLWKKYTGFKKVHPRCGWRS